MVLACGRSSRALRLCSTTLRRAPLRSSASTRRDEHAAPCGSSKRFDDAVESSSDGVRWSSNGADAASHRRVDRQEGPWIADRRRVGDCRSGCTAISCGRGGRAALPASTASRMLAAPPVAAAPWPSAEAASRQPPASGATVRSRSSLLGRGQQPRGERHEVAAEHHHLGVDQIGQDRRRRSPRCRPTVAQRGERRPARWLRARRTHLVDLGLEVGRASPAAERRAPAHRCRRPPPGSRAGRSAHTGPSGSTWHVADLAAVARGRRAAAGRRR